MSVCSQNRECLFGEVTGGEMRLNEAGRMVQTVWDELSDHYPGVQTDAFIIMPNHIHAIIVLIDVGAGPRTCPHQRDNEGQPQGVAPTMPLSLPDVVHRFKLMTTTRYRQGVTRYGWSPFNKKLWQRNYYEHIIRDENDLMQIRQYIEENPAKWEEDENHPVNIP